MKTIFASLFCLFFVTQVISFQYDRLTSNNALRESSSELSSEIRRKQSGLEHVRHKQHHKMRHPHRRRHQNKHLNDFNSQSIEKSVNGGKRFKPIGLFEMLAQSNIKLESPPKVEETEVGIFDNEEQQQQNQNGSVVKVHPNCPKCKQNSVAMSEEELTQLRISYVKNQILQKLRLDKRPDPVNRPALPKPIVDGIAIQSGDEMDDLNRRVDDYYAKTTQKILFLNQEFEQCKKHNKHYPSVCFSFVIPQDVDVSSVASAHLWIYKKQSNDDVNSNHTFEISEVSHWGTNKMHLKKTPLTIQDTNVEEGWVRIDLDWSIKNWMKYDQLTHIIQIACKTCNPTGSIVPIGMMNENKPFIVLDTLPQKNLNRQTRSSVNCTPGTTTCCREKLYISFADIGWDDWIIFPPGYDAYFCRGTCSTVGSITRDNTYHSTLMRELYHNSNNNTKKLELIPCCTATRYSSLQLVVYQDNVPTKKTLPNLVVESCGCM